MQTGRAIFYKKIYYLFKNGTDFWVMKKHASYLALCFNFKANAHSSIISDNIHISRIFFSQLQISITEKK